MTAAAATTTRKTPREPQTAAESRAEQVGKAEPFPPGVEAVEGDYGGSGGPPPCWPPPRRGYGGGEGSSGVPWLLRYIAVLILAGLVGWLIGKGAKQAGWI